MPETPRRLDRIFSSYDPLYFVTFNTHNRRSLLVNGAIHEQFVRFARAGADRAIAIARYVIMPDHIHLFVCGHREFSLSQWVRLLKRTLSKEIQIPLPHWQKGFFDHVIRHHESYAEKWEYVRQNPVRAGIAAEPDRWPYQGEIVSLQM